MALDPEVMITQHLFARMNKENCLQPGDREAVSYRIAEVMVLAKTLYMETLTRLMGESQEDMFDELAGFRMALLNLRDLISEFDHAFLEAMHVQRETDVENEEEEESEDEEGSDYFYRGDEEDEGHPEPQNGY